MKILLKIVLAVLALVALLVPCAGLAQTPPDLKLVIGNEEEANTYSGLLARLLYAEVSRRLGVPVEIATFPQQRRSELANSGAIDGETSRIRAYGDNHPNLVRVEEALIDVHFALYTAHPTLRAQRIEDLAAGQLYGEYRRGVLFCEQALKAVLPAERLSDVTEPLQGVKKLLARRTDVYCDLEIAVMNVQHDATLGGVGKVRKILDLGALPTYPYLHKRHAGLAPRMAAVIRKMKADGVIETLQAQAQRDLGWTR